MGSPAGGASHRENPNFFAKNLDFLSFRVFNNCDTLLFSRSIDRLNGLGTKGTTVSTNKIWEKKNLQSAIIFEKEIWFFRVWSDF
jgi:hypothetical protein